MSDELEVERGSDNPFRDAGLSNPDVELIKTDLAAAIVEVLQSRGLTQRGAARLVGVDQADLSRIRKVDLDRFTVDRLITILNRLNQRVTVKISEDRSKSRAA